MQLFWVCPKIIAYVIEVLSNYPGALLIVSHDQDFLDAIGVDTIYLVVDGKVQLKK